MQIKQATFVVSNSNPALCPDSQLPEYAFIGRSNVGKSSLINMLTGVAGLAKTSSQPGKTQLINHFLIDNSWHLVDLPGYGYARTSKVQRDKWQRMIRSYMLTRQQLACVFVLVDSRLTPQNNDLDFINFLGSNGIPLAIIFTKIDKESQRTVAGNVRLFKQRLSQQWEELPQMFLSSSSSGYGRDQIVDYIQQINETL